MTDEIAVRSTSTDLTITAEQSTFNDRQLTVLRSLGIDEEAPAGDVDLFFHQAKRTGLDPFAKQIYMIGRRTNVKRWDPDKRQKVDNWVTKYTIQTGIDGYRVLGHRTADARGDELEVLEPLWCGKDGKWSDAWMGPGPPAAAKITILVNGRRFVATALYAEYVQTYESGGEQVPNSMWRKMPGNQTAKCAEAAAWRLAYPADFSGMVLEDAVQVIDETGDRVTAPARVRVESRRGGSGLRERLAAKRAAEAAGPAAETESSKPAAEPDDVDARLARSQQIERVRIALGQAGYSTDDERGAFLADQLGRTLTGFDDMTDDELGDVLALLEANAAEPAK